LPLRQFVNPQPFKEQEVEIAPRQHTGIHFVIGPRVAGWRRAAVPRSGTSETEFNWDGLAERPRPN
jgi:hypothetical protein